MANQIRISPDLMRSRAGEYRTQAGVVGEVIRKMDTLLQQLQAETEGEASRAYAQRYTELRKSFVNAQGLITEIAGSLDSYARILEETDRNISNQFKK